MKFFIQLTFEECYQELLLAIQEHVNKFGDFMSPNNSCVQSLSCKYDGKTLYAKAPAKRSDEIRNEFILLTLENILQIPIFFNPNQGQKINNVEQYISSKLYQQYITAQQAVDPELHFIFYLSLTNQDVVNDISQFLIQLPKSLPFVIDFVTFPNDVSHLFRNELFGPNDSHIMSDNLSSIISLKEQMAKADDCDIKIRNIYFLQNFDEANHANQFTPTKISRLFGNLTLALIENYDNISSQNLEDPITTFYIKTFEIDRFAIINNWSVNIFKQLCNSVIKKHDDEEKIDQTKVDEIFQAILDEEKKGIEQVNSLQDIEVQGFLDKWKDELKETILNKIIDADLTNAERDLLLSYFQNVTNRDLLQLEDFDIEKFDLFDNLYIPFIDKTVDGDNPYSKIKVVILQIKELKEKMKKRQKNIDDIRDQIDENYHRDGIWTDDGYRIGNDVFKINKTDLIGNEDGTDDLLTEYRPDLSHPLPHNADLKSYFPPIKNQGKQGACASFSLTSVFEYFLSNETHKYDDMSEAFVYYNARVLNGKTSVDDGADLHSVIRGMVDKGVCVEELCEYDPDIFDRKPSPEAYEDGERRKVISAKKVPISVDVIKAAINEGYPVVGCFRIFKSLQKNTSGYIPLPTEEERQNDDGFHAMVICGYNDTHGHFIVRNSWGTGFGDSGYCYLPYSYVRDNDLTRYAVAITGIDAKEFIKHVPLVNDFELSDQDNNIRYAILLNLLKEDEHKLDEDRKKMKELVNQLKRLIDRIKYRNDLANLQVNVNQDIADKDRQIHQLISQKEAVSIWDNKHIHIIYGCILIAFLIIVGLGIYKEKQIVWISGIIASTIDVTLWVLTSFLSKRKRSRRFEKLIKENESEKKRLADNFNEKMHFRNRVVQILDAIGDIDDTSRFNRELLNIIIDTLNDCYQQISSYLQKNYSDEKDNDIVFKEWYNLLKIPKFDFLKRLLTSPHGRNIKEVLKDIQKAILVNLNNSFNHTIQELYDSGKSSSWKSFDNEVADANIKVYAQIDNVLFYKDANKAVRKHCAFFFSDIQRSKILSNVNHCSNFPSDSKNRFIFMKIKKVTIDELKIFKNV